MHSKKGCYMYIYSDVTLNVSFHEKNYYFPKVKCMLTITILFLIIAWHSYQLNFNTYWKLFSFFWLRLNQKMKKWSNALLQHVSQQYFTDIPGVEVVRACVVSIRGREVDVTLCVSSEHDMFVHLLLQLKQHKKKMIIAWPKNVYIR